MCGKNRNFLINKKGVSMHLDMIISFSIFIIFVLFLLLYIRPYQRVSFSETIVGNLHEKFGNRVHIDFTKFYLNVNPLDNSISSICINMNNFPIMINETRSRVLKDGISVDSSRSSLNSEGSDNGKLCINGGKGVYTVYLAKEFSNIGFTGGTDITTENYSIGGIETKDYWGNISLINVRKEYLPSSSSYETLKKELGFPLNMDFAVLCLNCNENYNMTREISDNSEVFASEYTQMILNQNGDGFEGKFLFIIW